MSKSLVDYVEQVYQIEKSVYEQNQFYNGLMRRKKELLSWQPEFEIQNNSWEDSRYRKILNKSDLDSDGKGLIWGFIAGVIGVIITYIRIHNFWGILLGLVIGFVAFLIVGNIVQAVFERKEDKLKRANIDAENTIIQQKNEKNQAIINGQIGNIENQISIIEKNISQTRKILNDYYEKNIIYSKYRNIYAVSSICEYLKSGRCATLEGATGAYNLYEQELRQGIIINKLDTIISQLNRIEENQYLLYSAINEANNMTKKLMSKVDTAINSLQEIKDNSEIAAYNSQITARNAQYQSTLMTYAAIVDYEDRRNNL